MALAKSFPVPRGNDAQRCITAIGAHDAIRSLVDAAVATRDDETLGRR